MKYHQRQLCDQYDYCECHQDKRTGGWSVEENDMFLMRTPTQMLRERCIEMTGEAMEANVAHIIFKYSKNSNSL